MSKLISTHHFPFQPSKGNGLKKLGMSTKTAPWRTFAFVLIDLVQQDSQAALHCTALRCLVGRWTQSLSVMFETPPPPALVEWCTPLRSRQCILEIHFDFKNKTWLSKRGTLKTLWFAANDNFQRSPLSIWMDENHHSTLLPKTGTLFFSSGCWPIWTRNNVLTQLLLTGEASPYTFCILSHSQFVFYLFFLRPRLNRPGTCWKCKWTVWVQMEGEFGDKSQSFKAGWKWWWRIEVKNDKNRDEHGFCHWQHGDQSCGWREWETEIEREGVQPNGGISRSLLHRELDSTPPPSKRKKKSEPLCYSNGTLEVDWRLWRELKGRIGRGG